jgi:hypothetical protein
LLILASKDTVVEAILKIAEILFNDVYDCIRVEVGQEWRAAGSDEPIPDALMTSSGTSTVFMTFQGKYYTNFMTSQDRYFQCFYDFGTSTDFMTPQGRYFQFFHSLPRQVLLKFS